MEDVMKFALVIFALGLTLGQELNSGNSTEYSFKDGGAVHLKLASGDYTVRAGAGDHIVVRWQPENSAYANEMKKIRVRSDVSNNIATIRTEGPTRHAHMVIEIPARSDLYLNMRAGDVLISGIEGNKNIHMTAGDLKVEVLPAAYSHVHASVTFGDVSAQPLGISKDGIKNSFDWNGSGKYNLDASLFAGDLTLSQARPLQ
jgi:hypothetical protein